MQLMSMGALEQWTADQLKNKLKRVIKMTQNYDHTKVKSGRSAHTLDPVEHEVEFWGKDWYGEDGKETGNIFIDVVNLIFGSKGLFDMCANADIHPMAQISALGKGMIESAIRNIGFALLGQVGSIAIPVIGPAIGAASSFLFTVAAISILIGFILFYLFVICKVRLI